MHNLPALTGSVVQARQQVVPFAGLVFRSIHLRHFRIFGTVNALFAAGGGVAGSRYVAPNGPAALYAALDADTAHREGNQTFYQTANSAAGQALLGAGGLRPDPVVLIGAHVRAVSIMDLRDNATRLTLGIHVVAELLAAWRGIPNAPTQVLGHAVFKDGHFEGILFPSAQNANHDCLVLFPAQLQAASSVTFFDATTNLAGHLP